MSAATDTKVGACTQCQAPLFEEERFCELCGTRVSTGEETRLIEAAQAHDRVEYDLGSVGAVTDRGVRRQRNEDAVAIAAAGGRAAIALCDGVASTTLADRAAQGAAAAALAVLEPLLHAPRWPSRESLRDRLGQAFAEAQRVVCEIGEDEPDLDLSPSTTMVVALATHESVTVANIGDSRAYWLSATGDSRALTVDDTFAQTMIGEGIPAERALAHPDAHTITRWIGNGADSVEPTVTTLEVAEAGLLLLCSDGLWNYFDDPDRLREVATAVSPDRPIEIARHLTQAALDAGGQDNVTVAVLPLEPDGPPAKSVATTRPEEQAPHG